MMEAADAVEGNGVGVVLIEVVVDGHLQIGDGMEHASTDAFSGDFGEEALDQIEPGADVGVKCMWKRGWRANHALTLECLWVA